MLLESCKNMTVPEGIQLVIICTQVLVLIVKICFILPNTTINKLQRCSFICCCCCCSDRNATRPARHQNFKTSCKSWKPDLLHHLLIHLQLLNHCCSPSFAHRFTLTKLCLHYHTLSDTLIDSYNIFPYTFLNWGFPQSLHAHSARVSPKYVSGTTQRTAYALCPALLIYLTQILHSIGQFFFFAHPRYLCCVLCVQEQQAQQHTLIYSKKARPLPSVHLGALHFIYKSDADSIQGCLIV